ncbi:ankyrin repeat [Trichoderma arundinaceum]|uniref:Ankyrin repeat n=1 Tax=Trichoderma arundinaceum TaxID=490622 RepID=A0A395NJK1_TRIAR|nr:ankyrin repeat [Trichoderma arundinaceum]
MHFSAHTGAGGPLIAGASSMLTSEFGDFADDDVTASNLFPFASSPDDLQSLGAIGPDSQKLFLNPQELRADGTLPDSPSGSLPDSSSDSASSTKRSPVSTNLSSTTTDTTMDNGLNGMGWGSHNMSTFVEDDPTFALTRDGEPSGTDGLYNFDDGDDTFMDQTFDFNAASESPEATTLNSQTNITSPSMPTIETQSPRPRAAGHKKNSSTFRLTILKQHSVTSSRGRKRDASRELSPMSSMVASHSGSPPGTLFNMPSPNGGPEWPGVVASPNSLWANHLTSPPHIPNTLASQMNFAAPISQSMHPPQQMPILNKAPLFSFTGGYELRILPTPLKSRVETQIPIKMVLNPLPPGITKLHLPTHTISKPKLMAKPTPDRSPDTLELFVSLVCTSAMDQPELKKRALERAVTVPQGYLPDLDDEENSPQNGGEVRICTGCITRERKRAARKKVKKPEEDKLWSQDEERRVVVFNTQEIKEWQPINGILDTNGRPELNRHVRAMQVDAPMRIACYCRHHNEKMGFNVIFTVKDWKDNVIAQAMSNPIMITDDHKTNPMTQLGQPAMSEAVSSSSLPMHLSQPMDANNVNLQAQQGPSFAFSPSSLQSNGQAASYAHSSGKTTPTMAAAGVPGRPLSRPPSPSQGGPAKKRKSSASRVPNGLAMTRMDASPNAAPTNTASQNASQQGATPPSSTSQQVTAVNSPFSPPAHSFSQPEAAMMAVMNGHMPFPHGPPTPSSNEQPAFFGIDRRSTSIDDLVMNQLYSAPASNHPSRAPSPNGLRNGVNSVSHNQLAQALAGGIYSMPVGTNQPRPPPIIHKIIPSEGPKLGGIEVTVLGASFYQGLEVWFGECRATTTTFWGESSLVCLLPPSPVAGPVPVTFSHQGMPATSSFSMGKQPPVFRYIDDSEDKLIRTALSVLGHKMSGQMVDVSDLARRILDSGTPGWSNGSSSTGPSGNGPVFNRAASNGVHLESQLLKVLDLIDLDDSAHRTQLDLTRSTGHTMLHLACSLGYYRLVAALLARGANPDARDNGGFTPLHLAAMHGHKEIAQRLMHNGADPTMRSLSGLSVLEVTHSREMSRTIRSSQRHMRSRSGGSLHSRTSSAASLRSLWEPLTRAQTHEEPISVASGEESPEYTSGDFEDEDPDENNYLRMRRPSRLRLDRDAVQEEVDNDVNSGVAAQTAALAATLKNQVQEQLQQFQQLAQQLQNLAHLPQIPQMPQMPQMPSFSGMQVLPDYQAYLQQAPFVRRVQQLMPGMSGNRPDNQADNGTKVDGRWWDLSSYMNGVAATAPPAYEDIYPGEDLDRKVQSAARAAVDAEADLKCSNLYDQQQPSVTAAKASAESSTQIPAVLEIGRKHAITKEQQENFLRAREQKLKKISSDRNLFFIWIPLLLAMVCALLYSYFPSLFPFIWTSIRAIVQAGHARASRFVENTPNRVVEV